MEVGRPGKNLAIIPARAGSKRVPRKNFIDFMGKPMIAWTIEAAKESNAFDRILVSTDSPEIAGVAKSLGLEVPYLRNAYADDTATVYDVSVYEVNRLREQFNEEYENVTLLMANCPLRNAQCIRDAFDYFVHKDHEFQISCFKFGWMNPWWAAELGDSLVPTSIFPGKINQKSQNLPDLHCPTGAIRIANCNALLKGNSYYGENHIYYPMDWKFAVDIDNYEDLEFAKAVYSIINTQ